MAKKDTGETEQAFRLHLKEGPLARVYLFYGEERYLTEYYARQVMEKATGGEALGGFNCQYFEGDADLGDIEDAVEALPLMAEQKCVVVRDLDAAPAGDRLLKLVEAVPETTVLVFRCETLLPDMKKNAAWRHFAEAVGKHGYAVECGRMPDAEVARLIVTGAVRRGCTINGTNARFLLERVGNDLYLLFNELDKLAALANGGEIDRALIEMAATQNLEASVFRLSDAIWAGDMAGALSILHALAVAREEPVAVCAVLSGAYVDLYRARVMEQDSLPQEEIIRTFGYKGKEFRLRNAAQRGRRLSQEALRRSIDLLAEADMTMKSGAADKQLQLERLVIRLIEQVHSR